MILAVLDDLMFSSKIKTAAGQLGVAVTFARSAETAIAEMRKIRAVARDPRSEQRAHESSRHRRVDEAGPGPRAIPTVGYASHVQTDVINAARQAGVGEVLPRSAFTVQLADILRRG